MKSLFFISAFFITLIQFHSQSSLELIGVLDLDLPSAGSTGKAIHVKANQAIADLSNYGIGVANNGGGTDGQEYAFPALSVSAGDHIIVCRDTSAIVTYFSGCSSFEHVIEDDSSTITQNGDDAIELFENGSVIETFGDVNVDGTGELWEYKDSWAFKDPNGSISFSGFNWTMGGVDCTDGSVTSLTSNCPYPHCISQPSNVVDITFKVNMSQVQDPFSTPELNGTFNNWCGNCLPLTDLDGDEIWEVTTSLNIGDTLEYKFSADNWAYQEMNDPNASCTNGDPNYTNRVLVVPSNNSVLSEVCWGSCDPCSSNLNGLGTNDLYIYPNPTNHWLKISSSNIFHYFNIVDITGKKILESSNTSSIIEIDVSSFNKGLYIIILETKDLIITKKFNVE